MYYDDRKEIEEAIAACNDALNDLDYAKDYLKSARNWGIWDILGGGFISTFIKRSKMDKARACMENARRSLLHLADELDDIEGMSDLGLDMDDFVSFADYFFDGFLADMMVQSRIADAMVRLDDAIAQVEETKGILLQRLDDIY